MRWLLVVLLFTAPCFAGTLEQICCLEQKVVALRMQAAYYRDEAVRVYWRDYLLSRYLDRRACLAERRANKLCCRIRQLQRSG